MVPRDEEGHHVMIKGSILQDITIVNIYASNIRAPKYIKHMLRELKGEININTVIVGAVISHSQQPGRESIMKEEI